MARNTSDKKKQKVSSSKNTEGIILLQRKLMSTEHTVKIKELALTATQEMLDRQIGYYKALELKYAELEKLCSEEKQRIEHFKKKVDSLQTANDLISEEAQKIKTDMSILKAALGVIGSMS